MRGRSPRCEVGRLARKKAPKKISQNLCDSQFHYVYYCNVNTAGEDSKILMPMWRCQHVGLKKFFVGKKFPGSSLEMEIKDVQLIGNVIDALHGQWTASATIWN